MAYIKYTESYEEKNVLFRKYDRIKDRCDAKPYFYNDKQEVKVKCYTDMLIACLAYENKKKEIRKLERIKDEYEDKLQKLNYHNTI
jgi:hypothetical protein